MGSKRSQRQLVHRGDVTPDRRESGRATRNRFGSVALSAGHVPEFTPAGLSPSPHTRRGPARRDSESSPHLPAFLQPQKAQLRRALPASGDWLYEVKYDGYRAQAAVAGDRLRVYSSSGFDWTGKQFAWLVPAFRELAPGPLLIDGEVCALDDNGRPDFSRLKVGLDGKHPLVFYAFELLVADDEDLTRLPLVERKARLEAVLARLPADSPIQYSWHTPDGATLLKAMRENHMEGVVAKQPASTYEVIAPTLG